MNLEFIRKGENLSNNSYLKTDFDIDNAIFFGHFVMVSKEGKLVGAGLIDSFNEFEVQISGKKHLRDCSIFIHTPPPEVDLSFFNSSNKNPRF